MNKTKVIETLESLPEEFSTEELLNKLLFVEKVEQGLKDVEDDKVISMQEMRKRVNQKLSK